MKKYYYTIGEVCNLLGLKQHVLRYWEKEFPQLNPKKKHGRNRRYNPDDIKLLKTIRNLLYDQKYTIDGAKNRLRELNKNKDKNNQKEFELYKDRKEVKKNKIKKELTDLKHMLNEL